MLSRALLHPGEGGEVPGPHPLDNVVGVGLGEQVTAGRPTGRRAIVVLVRTKFPAAQIAPANRLPVRVEGLTVDVQAAGSLAPLGGNGEGTETPGSPRARARPLRPGCSIGPSNAPQRAATLGLVARAGEARFAVTTAHGLAGAGLGDVILQPARLDGGRPDHDRVAVLERMLEPGGESNIVECAALRILSGCDAHGQRGPAAGEASVDMIVSAVGRTSDYTVGRVVSIDCDLKIGLAVFRRQILVEAAGTGRFAVSGDSGAVLCERSSQRAVGLLFAGGERLAAAHHIADVLDALGLELGDSPRPITLPAVTARVDRPAIGRDHPVFTRLAP
jgi:hypothetical protein